MRACNPADFAELHAPGRLHYGIVGMKNGCTIART